MLRSKYLLIALTGFVAMVSQTVWYRYATQILGQSSLTVAAVVAMALAGLAIGSHWAGKYKPRFSVSTLVIAMGATVLIAQFFFAWLPWIERNIAESMGRWPWTLLVACPLLPINFFVGATLPRLLTSELQPEIVGRLSASETLGGCVGAIFAGCVAIQTFGLTPTLIGTGILAVIAGIISVATGKEIIAAAEKTATIKIKFYVVAAVAIAGASSLGMEILWQRLLILIVGTDTYSYTIVVTSYLLGIAIGAAVGAMWLNRRGASVSTKRLSRIALLQILVGIFSLIVLAAVIQLASGAGQHWTNQPVFGHEIPLLKRFLLCVGLLLIPTSLQGATFPLIVDAVTAKDSVLAAPTSKIYAALAIGNVGGLLLCGFFLIPHLGLQQSVVILAMMSAVAALLLASSKFNPVIVVLTIVLLILGGHRLTQKQTIGFAINPDLTDQLYYREGPSNTVAVLAERANPDLRRMTVDGIVIGQSGRNAEEKQLMLAHLPTLLNFEKYPVEDVAVIGLGSGILSGEVAALPGVDSVTTVELSPAVIEASHQFDDLLPDSPLASLHTIQADGIHWLNQRGSQQQRFDAIISDGKSRPGHIGNAAFFSTDYYHSAADRLQLHGKFVQWYSLDAALNETEIVVNTFANSFPYAVMAIAAPDSIYLIGSNEPIEMTSQAATDYFRLPTSQSLKFYHWSSADDLRLMGWIRLDQRSTDSNRRFINSLDRPILERFSFNVRPETLTQNKIQNLQWLKSFANSNKDNIGLFVNDTASKTEILAAVTATIDAFTTVLKREKNWLDVAAEEFLPVVKALPRLHRSALLANSYLIAAKIAAEQRDSQSEMAMLKRAGKLIPADLTTQLKIGERFLELGDAESALDHFLTVIATEPKNLIANKNAAIALIKMKKIQMAAPYYKTATADPLIRLDSEFTELKRLFEDSTPAPGTTVDPNFSTETATEQELLDRMKELLQERPTK